MDVITEHKSIIYGYSDDGTIKSIVKYQDGVSQFSYTNASFGTNERVLKFIEYRGDLYAFITDTTNDRGRMLKLSSINEGAADTWIEVASISDLDTAPEGVEYFDDYLLIFSNDEVWKWDIDTLSSVTTSIPAYMVSIYSTLYYKDKIYILANESSSYDRLVEYDGATTFTSLSQYGAAQFPSGFNPIGKRILAEDDGQLYYPSYFVGGLLIRHDLKYNSSWIAMSLSGKYVTCIYSDKGVVFCAYYNTVNNNANITTYVQNRYYKEKELVPGEGKVLEGLKKVDSDPLFLVSDSNLSKVAYYTEYPVIGVLGGRIDPVIKYGSRLEFYTDLWDVDSLLTANLKEVMDMLCEYTDNYFNVDGKNIATISRRNLVGYSDKFIELKQDTDYGGSIIKEIQSIDPYEHIFRRIIMSWENSMWENINPISVGSELVQEFSSIDLGGYLINDPILAKNIALHMLDNMAAMDKMVIILSLAYFLEGNEIVSFEMLEDSAIQVTKDREWKILNAAHDKNSSLTTLTCLERSLLEERSIA